MAEKKPARRAATRKRTAVVPTNGTTALGQKVVDAENNQKLKYGDDIKAAARALYEGDPHTTIGNVASEMGIPLETVRRWSKGSGNENGEKWVKRTDNMSERAYKAADAYKGKLSDLGPEITTEQQKQAETDAADQTAAELRAQVLDRHRKEWNAPRKISYEAVQERNFDKAKLAKITSETLKLIQDGERKAWGIDSGPDGQTKVQVVIERE